MVSKMQWLDSQWTPYQSFYHIQQYITVMKQCMKHLLTHVCLVTVSCWMHISVCLDCPLHFYVFLYRIVFLLLHILTALPGVRFRPYSCLSRVLHAHKSCLWHSINAINVRDNTHNACDRILASRARKWWLTQWNHWNRLWRVKFIVVRQRQKINC